MPGVGFERVIAIGAALLLVTVADASGARVQARSARVTQKAIGVSLPRGVSGDARPQVACPSVSGCVATFGTANLLVLGEHRHKWTREATLAGVGVRALACPAVGSCAGTGWIHGAPKALVTRSGRTWHASAVQLPDISSPASAVLPSVSCGSAGDCAAVGWREVYAPGNIQDHALLAMEKSGSWGAGTNLQLPADVVTAPGPEAWPVPGGVASVVSCSSRGNCAVAGTYTNAVPQSNGPAYRSEGWVATEQAGQWQPAVSVQLPADADTKGEGAAMSGTSPFLGFTGISCPSAGNCTAVGGYELGYPQPAGMILTERNGVWLRGVRAPMPRGAAAPSEPNAWNDPLFSVSCAAADDCAAIGAWVAPGAPGPGGSYVGTYHGLLLTERSGKWSASKLVLPRGARATGDVFLKEVTCPSRGNCVAIGNYANHGKTNGLIEIEHRGKWQRAIKAWLPKNAAKASQQHAGLNSVSCPSTNRCTIVGSYDSRAGRPQGLILSLQIR
ncbi:MAG TPA: hypothetical protein VFU30_11015 [Gaiellaceae bacterium]|nr:hypothetical protein [Gaiellaceae bacterium]